MVLVATQVKRRRGTTAENDAFTGAEGEITVDTEKHQLRVHDGETQGGFVIGSGGSGRNIGDIFYTKRTDTGLAGAVECNGGTYNTEDYTDAGSIGELLAGGKLDYISLSEYATAISTKGWCDKIGWDGTGTTSFRVPTLTPHIIQKNNIPVVGDGSATHLYNTKGTTSDHRIALTSAGLLYLENVAGSQLGFTTDPTKSGIIADTTDTAQLRVMFQLFNSTTDEAVATVGGVLEDVAGLKDMSNITADGKEMVVGWGMPDYTTEIATGLPSQPTSSTTASYICPKAGYIIMSANRSTAGNTLFFRVNGVDKQTFPASSASFANLMYPVNAGDVITLITDASGSTWSINFCDFVACKGVN